MVNWNITLTRPASYISECTKNQFQISSHYNNNSGQVLFLFNFLSPCHNGKSWSKGSKNTLDLYSNHLPEMLREDSNKNFKTDQQSVSYYQLSVLQIGINTVRSMLYTIATSFNLYQYCNRTADENLHTANDLVKTIVMPIGNTNLLSPPSPSDSRYRV